MFRLARPIAAPPLPLLITGVSGVVGFNALPYFRSKYAGYVLGVRQRDNWRLVGPDILVCDAEDRDGLTELFDRHQFAAVLDCAGNCALKSCQLDPAMAWRINVEGVRNLLAVIAGRNVRLVHLSVDLVFSGSGDGGHVEDDPTDPVSVYGETMVRAEELILAADPAAAILRISLPMGISFNGHAGAIDWIQSRFRKSKPATLYYDEIRTPHYTDCLNHLCDAVLASDLAGIYHAGGARRLSLYQIAQVINRVGGYDPELLLGCPRHAAGPIPPRAGNVAMDSGKLAAALGYEPLDPWPLDDRWVPTDPDWHRRRTAGEPGSPALLAEMLYRNPRRLHEPEALARQHTSPKR
ncbi:MAG TPA: sugar nucleotide-binding protein [Pirellulales bacterium]|jgi:dTDP-4-dehydrorhamnose reductase|nr:sugar nucleotide-binding protein [Pirellulales bacterium]